MGRGVCTWQQHRGQILPTILFAPTRLWLLSFGCPQLMAGTRKGSSSSNVHSATTTIARTTGTRSFKLVPPSCCVACFCRQLSFFIGVTRSGSVAAGGGSLGSESRCCLSYFFRPDHSLCFLHLWIVGKFCLCPRLLLISLVYFVAFVGGTVRFCASAVCFFAMQIWQLVSEPSFIGSSFSICSHQTCVSRREEISIIPSRE